MGRLGQVWEALDKITYSGTECKGKGKGHPCRGTEALYRPYGPQGSRGIVLLFHDQRHQNWVRGQRHPPAAIYPRERPGTHCTGGWVGPRAGLDRCEKSRIHRDSISGPSSPQPVAIPTTLPGPPGLNFLFRKWNFVLAYETECNPRFICCSEQSAPRALDCGMTRTKGFSLWPAMEGNTCQGKEPIDWSIWIKGITRPNEIASQMSFSRRREKFRND